MTGCSRNYISMNQRNRELLQQQISRDVPNSQFWLAFWPFFNIQFRLLQKSCKLPDI